MSFRKLSDQVELSIGTIYSKLLKLASLLPHCADLTRMFCDKYCGILVVDGKFVHVKGHSHKLPFLYGIDYLTHDIPTYRMAHSESFIAWRKYFESLRLLNYPLRIIVCDDNENIRLACRDVYPNVYIQLCHVHFKESIRRTLKTRSDSTYRGFMHKIEDLFRQKRSGDDFNRVAKNIFNEFKSDLNCLAVILNIQKKKEILLGYLNVKGTPVTTNLIECFNSHFDKRFDSLKEFDSFKHANIWINALILRRRFKKFTDCRGKFRSLNGKSSLEKSKKSDVDLPTFLEFLGDHF